METQPSKMFPTRTRTEDPAPGPWRCGHCGGIHWRGSICTCSGFEASRNLPEQPSVDDIELVLP